MKKIVFLLLILTFTSCVEVIYENHYCIVNKVYHEPYTDIRYIKNSDGGITPLKTKNNEKHVLILHSIDLNETIKKEVEKEFYEKHNIGDTISLFYTTLEIKYKYQ